MTFADRRYSGGSINVHTEKRISCVLRCGCRGCCACVGGRDVECNATCCQLCGAARRTSGGAAPHSTARRSPGARSAHKPSGPGAGGEQCSASAPGPPYVWLRDRGDVRICNQRRAKSHSESWRYILRVAPIAELLTHSSAKTILDRALGWNEIEYYHGQIAIRQAHNTDKPYPPTPHIDGTSSGANGVAPGSGISNFTALVGVFLTRVDTEFAGNFTVWPGSHTRLETYFRNRGRQAMQEGMPQIELGDPVQLFADPGDVVLCHYQLAHAAAVNLSSNDWIAVYFRVWLKRIEEQRWELLTNIWNGWRS